MSWLWVTGEKMFSAIGYHNSHLHSRWTEKLKSLFEACPEGTTARLLGLFWCYLYYHLKSMALPFTVDQSFFCYLCVSTGTSTFTYVFHYACVCVCVCDCRTVRPAPSEKRILHQPALQVSAKMNQSKMNHKFNHSVQFPVSECIYVMSDIYRLLFLTLKLNPSIMSE